MELSQTNKFAVKLTYTCLPGYGSTDLSVHKHAGHHVAKEYRLSYRSKCSRTFFLLRSRSALKSSQGERVTEISASRKRERERFHRLSFPLVARSLARYHDNRDAPQRLSGALVFPPLFIPCRRRRVCSRSCTAPARCALSQCCRKGKFPLAPPPRRVLLSISPRNRSGLGDIDAAAISYVRASKIFPDRLMYINFTGILSVLHHEIQQRAESLMTDRIAFIFIIYKMIK